MRIFVIGSGGREHALVWKLAQSPHTTQMWCAPGNGGIAAERLAANGALVKVVSIGAEDLPALLAFARENQPDLTVVGPDNPLALGIVDLFHQHHLRIWGPNRQAAQFEASKVFAQSFMERWQIPTARSGTFSEPDAALRFCESLGGQCAVKADGLALGKGVLICHDLPQAEAAVRQMLVEKAFGTASQRIVIQELLSGVEVSLHAICDGRHSELFPASQDHKRALDQDAGPNTGGMGAYSPAPFLQPVDLVTVRERILDRWVKGCRQEGIDFRGILYPGIMLTADGPKVLEFNARFGDPETQVYLPRLETDLVELLNASVDGTLNQMPLRWNASAAVCVVLASAGYPGAYTKGKLIAGLDAAAQRPNTKVFHAGTLRQGDQVFTNGGRVLGVTSWGATLQEACDAAYEAVACIQFEGRHFRHDIAAKALRRA